MFIAHLPFSKEKSKVASKQSVKKIQQQGPHFQSNSKQKVTTMLFCSLCTNNNSTPQVSLGYSNLLALEWFPVIQSWLLSQMDF